MPYSEGANGANGEYWNRGSELPLALLAHVLVPVSLVALGLELPGAACKLWKFCRARVKVCSGCRPRDEVCGTHKGHPQLPGLLYVQHRVQFIVAFRESKASESTLHFRKALCIFRRRFAFSPPLQRFYVLFLLGHASFPGYFGK